MSEQLPHILPGQPRRSMYGEHNTHDEQVTLTAGAYQTMANHLLHKMRDASFWTLRRSDGLADGMIIVDDLISRVEREPIRVVAEVGRRIES